MTEKTKKIILLIAICVVTFSALFIALKLNENKKVNDNSISLINDYLAEAKYEDINNHIIEQPNIVVYVLNSSDSESNDFDKKFVSVIKKYNLENEIIYININNLNLPDPIYQHAPEFVFYKNGEIIDIIDCNTLNTSEDIVKIFKQRGVISD